MNWVSFLPGLIAISALAASWNPIGPFGGAAQGIVANPSDPKMLMAATRNGLLYVSRNSGETWTALPFRSSATIHVLAVAPGQSPAYYLGVQDEGIYRSTDSGATWTLAKDLRGVSILSLAIFQKDPRTLAAGSNRGVFLSRDSGDHWQRISSAANAEMQSITSIAIDPENPAVIYAGTSHLPWRTTSGGAEWRPIHSGMIDDSDVFSIEIDRGQSKHILASACSGIYSSQNSGDTWLKIAGIPHTSRRTYVIRQDPADPDVVYAGTSHGLWKSVRGAWREVSSHVVKSIAFDGRRAYFATEDAGLLTSTDGAKTMEPINKGFTNLNLIALTAAGDQIYTAAIYQPPAETLFRWDMGAARWMNPGPARNLRFLAPLDSKIFFAATFDEVLKSVDAGEHWTPVSKNRSIRALKVLRTDPPQILLGTDSGLLRTVDLGVRWTPVKGIESVESIAAAFDSAYTVVQAGDSLQTSSNGEDWTTIPLPVPAGELYQIAIGPNHELVAGTSRGAYRLANQGASWEQVIRGATVRVVYFAPGHEAFAVRADALFESTDAGRTWTPLEMSGIDGLTIRSLAVISAGLFAQTLSQGVYVSTLPGAAAAGSYPSLRDSRESHGKLYVSLQVDRD